MVSKTIGSGGDYTDIGLAWAYLMTLNPVGSSRAILDDYTFTIISDFTENTGVSFSGINIIFNGHTVKFTNPNGYLISASLYKSYSMLIGGSTSTIADTLIFDRLIINYTSSTGIVFNCYPAYAGRGATIKYLNVFIYGNKKAYFNIGINYTSFVGSLHMLNCIISTIGTAFNEVADANSSGTDHMIENCIFYNCNNTAAIQTAYKSSARNYTYKNTISFGCNGCNNGSAWDNLINCAWDSIPIANMMTQTSCITGIVAGDFISVNPIVDTFLFIDENSVLFEKGTAAISTWNTEGIDGLSRPNNIGKVSIGINEPIHKEKCMIRELELFLAKKQATFGTQGDDLTGSDYFPALPDSKVEVITAMTDIETVSAIYDHDLSVRGFVNANVDLSCYMRSLGDSTEPDYGLLAKASGWAVAGPTAGKYTYIPITTVTDSTGNDLEVWHYGGGIGSNASVLTKVGNVMGNWKITGDVGKPVVFSLTGAKGIFISQAAATMAESVIKNRTLIPAALPVTVSINGVSYKIMKFSFEGGNTVEQYIDCAEAYGFGDSEITKKKIKFGFTCYANAALANPLDAVIAGDVVADVSIIWGKALYTTKILVDDPQFTDCKTVDIGGLTGWEVSGIATQNDITIIQNNDHV